MKVVNVMTLDSGLPAVLKSAQVRELLNMSPKTFRATVEAGTLRPLPLKGVKGWRFSAAAVMKLVNG